MDSIVVELVKGLATGGPLAILGGMLILVLGRKVDRLHDAILELAKGKNCQYKESEE